MPRLSSLSPCLSCRRRRRVRNRCVTSWRRRVAKQLGRYHNSLAVFQAGDRCVTSWRRRVAKQLGRYHDSFCLAVFKQFRAMVLICHVYFLCINLVHNMHASSGAERNTISTTSLVRALEIAVIVDGMHALFLELVQSTAAPLVMTQFLIRRSSSGAGPFLPPTLQMLNSRGLLTRFSRSYAKRTKSNYRFFPEEKA